MATQAAGQMEVLVVGAGVFGASAALELARRGHSVRVVDPGPLPRPEASSTDTSRAVRFDYGADEFFTEMAEVCLPRWRQWDAEWVARTGEPVFHADGFLFLTRDRMQPGGFEYASYELLSRRGWPLQRLDAASIRARFPLFGPGYIDGYLNPHDGWVDSGRVVELLVDDGRRAGVVFEEQRRVASLIESSGRVVGVELADGGSLRADVTVLASGVWTAGLAPWLQDSLSCVGQAVFYFAVDDPSAFRAPRLPTWAADIAKTGWYGFPAVPPAMPSDAGAAGIVKIANHGPGRVIDPDAPRVVLPEEEARCRAFLAESLPVLADARVVRSRICPYCDSWDGAFLIDRDPSRAGLVVATGGSGHGFKFAPLLGEVIADAVLGQDNRWGSRFRWRAPGTPTAEDARWRE